MIFGFGRGGEVEEEEELELITFQGALNGQETNLKANARLVEAGLQPAKEFVSDALLRRAETMRLEPKGRAAVIRLFIDGVPYPGSRIAKQEGHAVTQMLKLLAGLDVKQRKKRQRGGIKAEFQETPYHLYVESEPTSEGVERLTVRARNMKQKFGSPEDLGFSEEMKSKLREMTSKRSGVVLACGPPGSGTTTTRFGLVRSVDAYQYGVYTIGDLEDRDLPYTTQFEVKPEDDLSTTLQRIIRMDADVVMTDPIRNAETAKVVFANQKHVTIISEFAARDVVHGLSQLLEWVEDRQAVADGLSALVSQKLLRLLCNDCKQAFRPNPKLLQKVGLPKETKVMFRPARPDPEDPEAEPCETCGGIGYWGRIGMFEMLEITDGIREAVLAGDNSGAFRARMKEERMQSFQSEGLRLVAEGKTSLEELQRVFKKS